MKVQKILLGMVIAGASLSVFGAVEGEVAFTLNTFAFLIFGALVMWMCAGFTMLEAGSVRTKNASVICMKNIGLYSIAGLMYYIIGYNVMYGDGTPFFGAFEIGFQSSEAEGALFHGDADASIDTVLDDSSYSAMSGWFFQMVFVATTASIISGALAERVRLISFFMFVIVLTGLLYPIVGKWTWGGGWLIDMGFVDFAGSTIVHSTGGWAALAGVIIVGARSGKFLEDGSVRATPPSNVPIVTLGVFILWLGWFGFNGGSQLALGSGLDAISMGVILVNTNLAAASGCLIAMALSRPVLGRLDLFATLNGAIAGLVAITAAPNFVDHIWAIPVGAVGGAICVLGMKALDLLKLDDVVGAIPAHLFAGIWGTLAASFTVGASFVAQLTGIVAIGVMVFVVGFGVWMIINLIFGVRVSERTEQLGQDVAELGIEAYPEFVVVPDEQIIGPDK
ncbi:MAG: ammonium transporter [Gammaproteobacteria bacterium]|nr:ammonium transporter [Gammaproteobacteria bacterium]